MLTTCIDAVKDELDLTIAGYVNEMVGARVNLELTKAAFKGSPVDRCIAQVLNTGGVPVQTIVQGLIDRLDGLHDKSAAAKASKATQQIEDCQLCGDRGHMA